MDSNVEKQDNPKKMSRSLREYLATRNTYRLTSVVRGQIDRPMLIIILILVCVGSAMVYSASYPYALAKYGDSAYFIRKQLQYVVLGLILMVALSFVSYKLFYKFAWAAGVVTLGLLLFVLAFGTSDGEAKRWIAIGSFSFQPSEVAKIGIIIVLAGLYSKMYALNHLKHRYWLTTLTSTVIPGIVLVACCGLVFLENHVSGTILIGLIGLSVMWAGGAKKIWYVIGLAAVAGVFIFIYANADRIMEAFDFLPEYAAKRIDMWINPESYDAQDDTWQTVQGLIAVGSGGFFGRGFRNSLQKHLFVSQPQNDFIFSIVAEELGFIGCVCIIALFIAFIWRGLYIARRSPDTFSSLVCVGIVAHIGVQVSLNMMVVTSIIPNTGITLPFFSYGGSSLIILLCEMGLLLNISRYTRISK